MAVSTSGLFGAQDIYRLVGGGTSLSTLLPYRWVAVGDSAGVWTCDDTTAATWTQRTTTISGSINNVASNSQSLYVLVADGGQLATSPDGATWTQRTPSSFSTSNITGIAYGNGYWVATGQSGKIATSTDGITWTQRTSGTANYLYQVAYGNGVWVAAGASGTLVTATDPTGTWTSRTSTITGSITALTYITSAATWVAGTDTGTTGALAYSSNGTSWTAATSSVNITSASGANAASSSSLAVITLAGNSTGGVQAISTPDGINYTNRTLGTGTGANSRAVASDNSGRFIVLTDGTSTAGYWGTNYSSNGTTWTAGTEIPATGGLGTIPLGICHSSGTASIR